MSEDLTQRKRTMIKNRVGCVRTSTYSLPQGNHVYGYKQPTDPEGAGACKLLVVRFILVGVTSKNYLGTLININADITDM